MNIPSDSLRKVFLLLLLYHCGPNGLLSKNNTRVHYYCFAAVSLLLVATPHTRMRASNVFVSAAPSLPADMKLRIPTLMTQLFLFYVIRFLRSLFVGTSSPSRPSLRCNKASLGSCLFYKVSLIKHLAPRIR